MTFTTVNDDETKVKTCKRCKYYYDRRWFTTKIFDLIFFNSPTPVCKKTMTVERRIDLVSGKEKVTREYKKCSTFREGYSSYCGTNGRFWVPINPTPEDTMEMLKTEDIK